MSPPDADDETPPAERPKVSFVIPARNEAASLPATLRSIGNLATDVPHEVVVVDGGSADATPEIAERFGARVIHQRGRGIGAGRHAGAERARGEWLAFVDADTTLHPDYLDRMLAFVGQGYDAASSRCRIAGPRRAKLMELVINHVFPRLERPILPGFNLLVAREVYDAAGGFPDVPNEDTAFSRALGRRYRTGYCPDVLVVTSGRRIRRTGLTGTLVHYLRLDAGRLRASR